MGESDEKNSSAVGIYKCVHVLFWKDNVSVCWMRVCLCVAEFPLALGLYVSACVFECLYVLCVCVCTC